MSNTSLETRHMMLIDETAKSGFDLLKEMCPQKAHLLSLALNISRASGNLCDVTSTFAIHNCAVNISEVSEALGEIEAALAAIRDALAIERDDILLQNIKRLELAAAAQQQDENQPPITE